jgi:hypothetical protein
MMQRREFLDLMTAAGYVGLASRSGRGYAVFPPPPTSRVPVIYSTDLFHPPDDPDDHVDLATLFALPELDVRAIILDLGHQQRAKPGEIPVRQMAAVTGKKVPSAAGLLGPLRYPEDKAENQNLEGSGDRGIQLILRALRESARKVYIFTTGSVRDVAAAFNRDEALFREKVERVYVNAGNSGGLPTEWNTLLDPLAYIRIMSSGLPIYWCPAFGPGATFETFVAGKLPPHQYATYWRFVQSDVFDSLPAPLQNFFIYALEAKSPQLEDPVAYLSRSTEPEPKQRIWAKGRNMWCTAPMIHAAGRSLYRKDDTWAALSAPVAGFEPARVFDFVAASVHIDRDMRTTLDILPKDGNIKLFHLLDEANYQAAMTSSLRRLLGEIPVARSLVK